MNLSGASAGKDGRFEILKLKGLFSIPETAAENALFCPNPKGCQSIFFLCSLQGGANKGRKCVFQLMLNSYSEAIFSFYPIAAPSF